MLTKRPWSKEVDWINEQFKKNIEEQKNKKAAQDDINKEIETKKAEQARERQVVNEKLARHARASFRRPGFREPEMKLGGNTSKLGG